jgi:anthranilate phosphoribosyltransferase
VLLNAAAALVVSRRVRDLKQGAAAAAEALDQGCAARVLERVLEIARA